MYTFIKVEIEIDRAYFHQFTKKRESSIDGLVIFWGATCQTFFLHAN